MREMSDKEMRRMVGEMKIPPHRPDLAERIISHTLVQSHAAPARHLRQGEGFAAWCAQFYTRHGGKAAMAAALLVAVVIAMPQEQAPSASAPAQQMATVTLQDPYSVDGIPLLADMSLVEESDWEVALLY